MRGVESPRDVLDDLARPHAFCHRSLPARKLTVKPITHFFRSGANGCLRGEEASVDDIPALDKYGGTRFFVRFKRGGGCETAAGHRKSKGIFASYAEPGMDRIA